MCCEDRESVLRSRFAAAVVGSVVVTRVRGEVAGPREWFASSDPGTFMIVLVRGGSVVVEQDDDRGRIRSGEVGVVDTGRRHRIRYGDPCDAVVLTVPRASFGPHADTLRRRVAERIDGGSGAGAVVAGVVAALGEQVDQLPGPSGARLGEALTSLLVAGLCEAAPDPDDDTVRRITAYALAHISDPDLRVDSVARRFGISPSRLHRLFRGRHDTFAAWLRAERLRRVHRDLRDPALSGRTVAAIAARWGLYDPGHLSRAFKARYGRTPAQIRRQSPAGSSRTSPAPARREPAVFR
ncbi:Transcriptional activator FeaR [Streptomyces sp. RB5]|uniref:Transcriptional activator FeaR n=2 Tax=Streptomyces smaragdinus TaxID=2585196 RepID=A0A7K0CJB8_9ACTN|nr:Transcriptional activator FeaR [Streptomyces smaragdinus]